MAPGLVWSYLLNKWFLFNQVPIKESLILYSDSEINDLSVECFMSKCLYTDQYTLWPLFLCSSITFPLICPSRPNAVHGWCTTEAESHPFELPEPHLTGQCSLNCNLCDICLDLTGVQMGPCVFCPVRVRKGAAERWNLLPGHQANHQQSRQVRVFHLFILNTC